MHSLQDIIGQPSTSDFIKYIERNLITNCPVTKADILFGMKNRSLKGNTPCRTTTRVVTVTEDLRAGMLNRHECDLRGQHKVHQLNPICDNYIKGYTFRNCRTY